MSSTNNNPNTIISPTPDENSPILNTAQVVETPKTPSFQQQPNNPLQPAIKRHFSGFGDFLSAFVIVFVALLAAIFLTLFVFQQYQVDGPSMLPTLQTGNRLIVLKLPQTWSKITGHPFVPARGDVIVFVEKGVSALNQTGSDQLIKRVIGLPGDRIVVKDNVITIYNQKYPTGFQPDRTLPYGKVIGDTPGDIDITVPKNEIFVCGDNRQNSLDSRIFGPVPVSNIIGRLVLRLTPVNEFKGF